MPRLLVCRECKTIDTIPLFDGPAELEAQDPLLDRVVRYHVQLHGEMVDGATLIKVSEDPCNCGRVPWNHTMWEEHKDEILGNLRERWTGFHPEFYATKNTYQEDAMRCFNLHRRPQGTDCIDWLDDRKRLTPNGWAGSHVYLCHFCPVASSVTTAVRWAKGYYKKQPGETE